jgi:hypothetical protein
MPSGNARDRRKQNRLFKLLVPPIIFTPTPDPLKRFTWSEPKAHSFVLELFATNLVAIGLTMWSASHYLLAEIFFFSGALLMVIRIFHWSHEFVPKDRRKAFSVGFLLWLFLCSGPGYLLYQSQRPSYVLVVPIVFDSQQLIQAFGVVHSWKPLTTVQITGLDQNSAMSLSGNSDRAVFKLSYPEVSASYLMPVFKWKKPGAFNPAYDDYLIHISSHEGEGAYSEELVIQHHADGKDIYRIDVSDAKNKVIFQCEDYPGFRDVRLSGVPNCSSR